MTATMMRCGCTATATDSQGLPVCVAHLGIVAGARMVVAQPPDLTGRMAHCCWYPHVPSSLDLPFFQHRPGHETDSYYCGKCYGWD